MKRQQNSLCSFKPRHSRAITSSATTEKAEASKGSYLPTLSDQSI